jgi:hypothetical protein
MHVLLLTVLLAFVPHKAYVGQNVAPCYNMSGVACGPSFHIDADAKTLTLASDCVPDGQCFLTDGLTFPLGAQFSNLNYRCFGNTQGSVQAVLMFKALSTSLASVSFYNQTGTTLGYGTPMPFAFACMGL